MLVRQSKNTFIRFIDNRVHILNQVTFQDRVYNETGADFLKEINRNPQKVDNVVDKLKILYGNSVSREELFDDFMDFITDLSNYKFLVVGETIEELDAKYQKI